MKQGLSLRVSQHLALTPQLQQSIRLLQLSTLELSQEVEQMLDENPFLERTAGRGAARGIRARRGRHAGAGEDDRDGRVRRLTSHGSAPRQHGRRSHSRCRSAVPSAEAEPDWDGDGTRRHRARRQRVGRRCAGARQQPGRRRATPMPPSWRAARSRCRPSCTARPCRLRLSEEDRGALRFLIESLNDDGYLEDSLPALASGLARRRQRAVRRAGAPLPGGAAACCRAWSRPAWARATWANA